MLENYVAKLGILDYFSYYYDLKYRFSDNTNIFSVTGNIVFMKINNSTMGNPDEAD